MSNLTDVSSINDTRKFAQRSYDEIVEHFQHLAIRFPELIEFVTAQDLFSKDVQLSSDTLKCGDGRPCESHVAIIGRRQERLPSTVSIYLSGAVHGDERLGPNIVTELATFLLENADINPRIDALLKKRTIWISPMTNPWGYAHHRRTELRVDVNRDFPYMRNTNTCMESITARVINELFRSTLFTIGITFHGGMRAMAYEWGSFNHATKTAFRSQYKSTEPPDDTCQKRIANEMRNAAGVDVNGDNWYPLGRMSDIVYPVNGGSEDWAYGASWEQSPIPINMCRPSTFGGYPLNRTEYLSDRLRTLMYLVETDDLKDPPDDSYGNVDDIFHPNRQEGHISRNVRMALKLIELAKPEIMIHASPPPTAEAGSSLTFSVNFVGCLHANGFKIWLANFECSAISSQLVHSKTSQITYNINATSERFLPPFNITNDQGPLLLLYDYKAPTSKPLPCQTVAVWDTTPNLETAYTAVVQLPWNVPNINGCLFLQGTFDQDFATQKSPDPNVPPQSHIARSRIERDYIVKHQGQQITGESYMFYPNQLKYLPQGIPLNISLSTVLSTATLTMVSLEVSDITFSIEFRRKFKLKPIDVVKLDGFTGEQIGNAAGDMMSTSVEWDNWDNFQNTSRYDKPIVLHIRSTTYQNEKTQSLSGVYKINIEAFSLPSEIESPIFENFFRVWDTSQQPTKSFITNVNMWNVDIENIIGHRIVVRRYDADVIAVVKSGLANLTAEGSAVAARVNPEQSSTSSEVSNLMGCVMSEIGPPHPLTSEANLPSDNYSDVKLFPVGYLIYNPIGMDDVLHITGRLCRLPIASLTEPIMIASSNGCCETLKIERPVEMKFFNRMKDRTYVVDQTLTKSACNCQLGDSLMIDVLHGVYECRLGLLKSSEMITNHEGNPCQFQKAGQSTHYLLSAYNEYHIVILLTIGVTIITGLTIIIIKLRKLINLTDAAATTDEIAYLTTANDMNSSIT